VQLFHFVHILNWTLRWLRFNHEAREELWEGWVAHTPLCPSSTFSHISFSFQSFASVGAAFLSQIVLVLLWLYLLFFVGLFSFGSWLVTNTWHQIWSKLQCDVCCLCSHSSALIFDDDTRKKRAHLCVRKAFDFSSGRLIMFLMRVWRKIKSTQWIL